MSAQKIIYVNQTAIGANNGKTWKDAHTNLVDALATAKQNDTVCVVKGMYKPTDQTDRYKTFAIKEGICVLGGFDGTEIKVNQRDAKKNVTILSGNIGQQVVKIDNSYNVITIIPNASNKCRVYLDGFMIRDGCANNNSSLIGFYDRSNHGGGIFINTTNLDSVNIDIINCTITENYAQKYGGGIAEYRPNQCNVKLNISKTLIEKDTAKSAGGFFSSFSNDRSKYDFFTFDNNIYRLNSASFGGCFAFYSSSITNKYIFRNSIFEKNYNQSENNIALFAEEVTELSTVLFKNNTFFNNKTKDIMIRFRFDNNINLNFDNNIFYSNILTGIVIINPSINKKVNQYINNNIFYDNRVHSDSYSNINSLFQSGQTNDGKILILNNLFLNNDFSIFYNYFQNSNTWLVNNIIMNQKRRWLNININNNYDPSFIHVFNNISDFKYKDSISNRYDLLIKCDESNRFATTPRFIDTLNGNYRLHQCSVGINIGNDSIVKALGILTDIEGNPRIADGRVDIGPYERQANYDAIPSVVAPKCFGDKAKLNFDVKLGTPPYTYKWLKTNTMGSSINDLKGGTYQFTVSDSEGCKDSLKVVIPNAPDAIVISDFDFKNATGQTPTGSVTITKVIGGTPPYKYTWSNGVKDSLITKLTPGSYTVTITDKNDCVAQLNFGINASTATKDIAEKDILNVAPNPTADVVTFTLKMPYATLRLYDALGHELLTQSLREGENSLSIGHLPKGIYVYMLLTDNVLRASGRVLRL